MKRQMMWSMGILLLSSLAMAQDTSQLNEWNMGIEKRVTELENGHTELKQRVDALEKVTSDWNQGAKPSTVRGHDIIRGLNYEDEKQGAKGDSGEGAPVLTNDAIVALYIKHEADISKIWKAMPEEKTMRDAVELYLKMKAGKACDCILTGKCDCGDDCPCYGCPKHKKNQSGVTPSGLESQDNDFEFYGVSWKGSKPTNKGRELLFFTSKTCMNCPAAGERLKPLAKDIYLIDCTEPGGPGDTLAGMHRIDAYPTLIAIDDGIKVDGLHTEGDSVGMYFATKWLNLEEQKTADSSDTAEDIASLRYHMRTEHGYSAHKLSEMTDDQVRAAHSRSHASAKTMSAPKVVVRSSPPTVIRKSVPRMQAYSAPSYSSGAKTVVRYGGSSWTWPGNLRQHLESVHRVNTAGLSDSQLKTVHDNLHNTGRSGISGGSYSQPAYSRKTYVQPQNYGYSSYSPGYSSGYSNTYRPTTYFSSSGSYCPTCPR